MFGTTWALIALATTGAGALACSHRRRMPSWQPVASRLPSGENATASTKFGCGNAFVDWSEANFHILMVLSWLLLKRVALSAAKNTSVAGAAWAKSWMGLPKSGESG